MLKRPEFFADDGRVSAAPAAGLQDVLHFLWRRWLSIALSTVAGLSVGVILLNREIPRYSATANLLFDARKEKPTGNEAFLTDSTLDAAYLESQVAVLRSRALMRVVARRESLATDPEFGIKAQDASQPADAAVAEQAAANNLALATNVGRVGQANLLAVTVTSLDPQRAARLANAVVAAYSVYKLDQRSDAARRASGWLTERLQELKGQVRESEEAVARFRAEHRLVGASPSGSLSQQQLGDINARLVAARVDLAEKKARLDTITGRNARDLVAKLPEDLNQGALAALRQQQATLSQQEAELLARYNERHPLVVNLRAQRRDIERSMAAEVQRVADGIRGDYELAKSRVANLEMAVKQATGETGADNETAIRLRELERTAAVNKTLFEDFLQRAKVTEEQSTFDPREAQVINPAQPSFAPVSPIPMRILGLWTLFGLGAGIGAGVLREKFNTSFKGPDEIEAELGIPVVASIHRLDRRHLIVGKKRVSVPKYVMVKPLSRLSDSIRAIRTVLQPTGQAQARTIQVSSSVPGEGKTTLAMMLAASFLASKLRVLLIDADLRLPTASKLMGVASHAGLSDVLTGAIGIRDAISVWPEVGFDVLPSGSRTSQPADLLGSDQMRSLLEALTRDYDVIILDSSPLAPVVDGLVLSKMVDRTVFAVRWGATPREVVHRSLELLGADARLAGIVLNMVDQRVARKYGRRASAEYTLDPSYARYYQE